MTVPALVLTPDQFLTYWQGHRRLTRRMIEAFPESELFKFEIGGMRTFSGLILEIVGMAVPTLQGIITGEWNYAKPEEPATRADLLKLWDDTTTQIAALWPTIPAHRFQEVDTAFGQWEMAGYDLLLYIIDNEVHHRGQGYVYLRALHVEPPPFYNRS